MTVGIEGGSGEDDREKSARTFSLICVEDWHRVDRLLFDDLPGLHLSVEQLHTWSIGGGRAKGVRATQPRALGRWWQEGKR